MSQNEFIIAPSILSADFANLAQEIANIEKAGAQWVHVDVMDGHFVPNITIGALVVKSIRPVTKLPLDVHLMISHPEKYIEDFAQAGADYITIHIESTGDARACLNKIYELGCKPGITLRPGTPVDKILPLLSEVDLALVMTVEPGFGGQKFMQDQVQKIDQIREHINTHNLNVLIEVDGGINLETATQCKNADILVAGNFVFKNDYNYAVSSLKVIKGQ